MAEGHLINHIMIYPIVSADLASDELETGVRAPNHGETDG